MVAARARGWVAGLGVVSVLGSCVDSAIVEPVIDLPVADADATAAPLDGITLTVAHDRADRDLMSQTFARGEPLEMAGVPFGDDLVIHMAGYVGSSNIAYGRSCAFAVAANARSPAPHLFFSRSVKFASLGVAPLPRIGGLGISYLGSALLVGGNNGLTPEQTVERFDPATGQLRSLGTVGARERAVYALVGTSPPRVAVIGGTTGVEGAKFMEVLDGERIDRHDFVEMARVDLTATSLTDGRVIVVGGHAPGGLPSEDINEIAQQPDASFEVRKLTAKLHTARSGHTATRLGEDVGAPVLIAGGIDQALAPIAVAELFKPLSAELADPMTFAPTMQVPRSGHVARLMPDGSVLMIGGVGVDGPVRTLERFSIDAGFSQVGELPMSAGVIDFAATTLPDGRILLTGGRLGSGEPPSDSAYIVRLNLADGSVDVVATDHLAIPRADHQAVLLCDGTVLISGGVAGQVVAERYNPPPLGRR
jgi:hypothetical protein